MEGKTQIGRLAIAQSAAWTVPVFLVGSPTIVLCYLLLLYWFFSSGLSCEARIPTERAFVLSSGIVALIASYGAYSQIALGRRLVLIIGAATLAALFAYQAVHQLYAAQCNVN